MRRFKTVRRSLFGALALMLLAAGAASADECCECGCGYELKKTYRPIVTFRECTFQSWDYTTVCRSVLLPTTTCCNRCDGCASKCACPGQPKKTCVPIAIPSKCREYVRKVPVVTWVVESKCQKCCDRCKHSRKHR